MNSNLDSPELIFRRYKANITAESDIILDFFKAMIDAGYK